MSDGMEDVFIGQRCQSCGMKLIRPDEFGTTATGVKKLDYCKFCFSKGKFTEPDLTFEQMVERIAAPIKANRNLPDAEARGMAEGLLRKLKRWEKA